MYMAVSIVISLPSQRIMQLTLVMIYTIITDDVSIIVSSNEKNSQEISNLAILQYKLYS